MPKTCCILGANSFVGGHLIKWISENTNIAVEGTVRFESNIFWQCDITKISNIEYVIRNIKPDYIINATGYSDYKSSENDPIGALETNVNSVNNILYWLKIYKPDGKFINLGSIKEFSDNSFYSVSKRCSREIVDYYRNNGLWAAQLYISNTTGKNQSSEKFLIPKIIKAAKLIKDKKLEFLELGDLDADIKLLHIESAARLIWKAIENENPVDFVIDGPKVKVSEIVKIIFNKLGIQDYQQYIQINPDLIRPRGNIDYLEMIGDKLKCNDSVEEIIDKLL